MIKTAIVPLAPSYISAPNSLNVDYKAICCFAAIGFFLDDDTYFLNRKVRKPAHIYEDDKDLTGTPYFKWHYAPRNISFSQAVDEFADLFDTITKEQVAGKRVILPLSGGLDSRSQAAALKGFPNIQTYSYKFAHGFNETQYAEKIAQRMGWNFKAFTIPEGYLWRKIDELSKINHCYAEFTHPRQMAIVDEFPAMGDLFYIGHWGDVLFDDMGVKDDLPFDQQVDVLMKKIVKKGGLELGTALWQTWNLPGNFEVYLKERITTLLSAINIDNANARLRAFKSLYWVPRWTSVNLSVFQKYHPVALPYYDNRMCEFICTIPEKFLSGRQIQIEYIKRKAPELAEIPWQALHPCNLYN